MRERDYQVGDYWLYREPESGKYHIHWYDTQSQRTKRKSTGTSDLQQAKEVITALHVQTLNPVTGGGLSVRQVSLKYWQNHAQTLISSGTCRVSLDKLNRFLDIYESHNENLEAEKWTKQTTLDFIQWLRDNPSFRRKAVKDTAGRVIDYTQTPIPLSDKSINRTLDDVRAAFRYCLDRPPIIQGIQGALARGGRKKPTLSLDQMKALFGYAFDSAEREHLQNYLLIALTTLARPEAIIDISVDPARGQIEMDYRLIHQNPEGRQQTKKYRPSVPINDHLLPIIQQKIKQFNDPMCDTQGYLVEYKGRPIASIRQTWNKAKKALGWPMVRDWDAKMLRHTLSKHLRATGVPWPELQGQLGHSISGQTETYAEYEPDYLGRVQAEITNYIDRIWQGETWRHAPITPRLKNGVSDISKKNPYKSNS